jgi:hypothetical protein
MRLTLGKTSKLDRRGWFYYFADQDAGDGTYWAEVINEDGRTLRVFENQTSQDELCRELLAYKKKRGW